MRPVTYIYANSTLDRCGFGSVDQLATFTERHKIKLRVPPLGPCRDIAYEIGRTNADGIVFEMVRGWNDLEQIGLARSILHNRRAVWFYWPAESAIECIDEERLHSYKKLCMLAESLDAIRPASEFVSARIL